MAANYNEIKILPTQFASLLTLMGFELLETQTPSSSAKGFQRPVLILKKTASQLSDAGTSATKAIEALAALPSEEPKCTKVQTNQQPNPIPTDPN